jgi:hypothetical protein
MFHHHLVGLLAKGPRKAHTPIGELDGRFLIMKVAVGKRTSEHNKPNE